jgi:hypothetical protein
MHPTLRAAGICLLLSAAPALACEAATNLIYNKPVEIRGTLKAGKGQHEAQGAFAYSYVALDQPVCVASETEADEFNEPTDKPIDRIQIAGEAAGKDLPLGKHVKVSGTLFGVHTMWHAENVLIDASDVTPD